MTHPGFVSEVRRFRPSKRAVRRPGFTLVELLVATTVTLLLILAVAQSFAVVSEVVGTNRAMLEMAAHLRAVSVRLQADLDAAQSPIVPFKPSGAAPGYVEYGEGSGFDLTNVTANSALGDRDDYIMFTAESLTSPFSGRFRTAPLSTGVNSTLLHSSRAEIAWWARSVVSDLNGDSVFGVGEVDVTLYRRVVLVRPDLNVRTDNFAPAGFMFALPEDDPGMQPNPTTYDRNNQTHMKNLSDFIAGLNNEVDVSFHVIRIETGNQVRLRIVANSMADLSLRQNRFAHDIVVSVDLTTTPPTYTYVPLPTSTTVPPPPYGKVTSFDYRTLNGFIKSGDRVGEDVMLTNVMAFDVKAYDPLATVSASPGLDGKWGVANFDDDGNGTDDDVTEALWVNSDDDALVPGDLAYGGTILNTGFAAPFDQQVFKVGQGAYVDLHYHPKNANSITFSHIPASNFRGISGFRIGINGNGDVYDTWALDYEDNRFDEDQDGLTDEAFDGIDNDGAFSADDAGERETSPPYAVDLRGLQIRIRLFEPDTRQVRQSTVQADFTSE